jgi:hypothetical protein
VEKAIRHIELGVRTDRTAPICRGRWRRGGGGVQLPELVCMGVKERCVAYGLLPAQHDSHTFTDG